MQHKKKPNKQNYHTYIAKKKALNDEQKYFP